MATQRCCFDACGAGGRLYPLVHAFGVATVGGCLDLGAQVLAVHVSTAAGSLQGCFWCQPCSGFSSRCYYTTPLPIAWSVYTFGLGQMASSSTLPRSAPKPSLLKCSYASCCSLLFALASHTEAGLQRLVEKLSHACKEFGLTISLKKTNILVQDAETPPVITINNTELEVVDSFTYLGSTVSSKVSLDVEISSRAAKGSRRYGQTQQESVD